MCAFLFSRAQRNFNSILFYSTQSALPFGKGVRLFTDDFHPGIEVGRTRMLQQKENHDWMIQLHVGYFFHRFVQHAVYVDLDMGYRYKIGNLGIESFLGAGLLQSIPATAKLKLNDTGDYTNNKGIGRLQVSANLGLGLSYIFRSGSLKDIRFFTRYGQRIQFPFINAYVPLLPYNSFSIGGEWPIHNKK